MKEIILGNLAFFFGIIVAEIFSPSKKLKLVEELVFIFFIVTMGEIIFQKDFLLFGNEYYYYFFVGVASTYISNFILFSYMFLFGEIKHWQRISTLEKIKEIKRKLTIELKRVGFSKEEIQKFIKRF